MASKVRIELNHSGIEAIENSFADEALRLAEGIKARADSMRSDPHIAEYNARLRPGRKGGRRYAVVSADAPSTKADNARHNTLLRAYG